MRSDGLFKLWVNPEIHAKFHLFLTVFWIIMIIPTVVWFKSSIEYLVGISVYAVITGHFSSYEATRAEIITKKQLEGEFDDLQGEKMEEFLERKRNDRS